MMLRPLPIGIENFEKMIKEGYYYIDKTLLIKELLDKKAEVNLFTRPRRFGKSLNISMLQYFFDNTLKEKAFLFDGLKIMNSGEMYWAEMNRYPVIKLTLKAADQLNYESSFKKLKEEITREFDRHRYLLKSENIDEEKKELYQNILSRTAEDDVYSSSLRFLSECLEQYHNEKAIVLIDEYDVPLEKAYFHGYYKEMINFLRSFFNIGLKTNDSLYFSAMTGCLRIGKESIFTGFNNPKIISITSSEYGEYFGFTEEEVLTSLSYYQLENKTEEARDWYNGYMFGDVNIYNPWSIISYLNDLYHKNTRYPRPYWSNTSSNSIVRELIEIADDTAKEEIEALIWGKSITKPIHEDIVYSEILQNEDNLWNFLFFTGYLKKAGEKAEEETIYFELKIPNREVAYIYKRKIREWFEEKTKITDTGIILKAITEKDTETLSGELNKRLVDIISFYDTKEAFYHGFLLGILSNIQGYLIKSNRESGSGRSDIYMKDKGIRKRGMVFEIKIVGDKDDPEEKCREALEQIETKKYAYDLEAEGYRNVLQYGIAFRGKECMVMVR